MLGGGPEQGRIPPGATQGSAAERGGIHIQLVRAAAGAALARELSGDGEADRDLDLAERLLRDATTPAGHVVLYTLDAYLAVAAVRSGRGETDAAVSLLMPVLAAAQTAGWIEGLARTELALGHCSARRGDIDGATSSFQRALDASGGQLPAVEWQIHAAHAHLLSAQGAEDAAEGERARARSIVARLAETLDETALRSTFTTWAADLIDEQLEDSSSS